MKYSPSTTVAARGRFDFTNSRLPITEIAPDVPGSPSTRLTLKARSEFALLYRKSCRSTPVSNPFLPAVTDCICPSRLTVKLG